MEITDKNFVKKPHTILPLDSVDVTLLKDLIGQLSSQVWVKENERKENNFPCFHHTEHIIFRFIEGNRNHLKFYSNPIWEVFKSTLLPIMNQVTASYKFIQPEYPKVMLARLKAGGSIDIHRDGAGSNLCTHKIHIPLVTNSQAKFLVKNDSYHLKYGKAYEVNNITLHGAENHGDFDRIHLIFEVFESYNS